MVERKTSVETKYKELSFFEEKFGFEEENKKTKFKTSLKTQGRNFTLLFCLKILAQ